MIARGALSLVLACVVTLAVASTAGAFAGPTLCSASTELSGKQAIQISISCDRMAVSGIAIDAKSEVSWVRKRVVPRGEGFDAGRRFKCRVVRGEDVLRLITTGPGTAACAGGAASSALVVPRFKVKGKRCDARIKVRLVGGGPCASNGGPCKKALGQRQA